MEGRLFSCLSGLWCELVGYRFAVVLEFAVLNLRFLLPEQMIGPASYYLFYSAGVTMLLSKGPPPPKKKEKGL
jgi:hypothetical protein